MERVRVAPATVIKSSSPESGTPDLLAVEEPLEIRLEYGPADDRKQLQLAVTMRTPGNDFELTTGFLFTEGIIAKSPDISSIRYCENVRSEDEKENVVKVMLDPACDFREDRLQRNFYTTSSCGVCGKSSLESIQVECGRVESAIVLRSEVLYNAPTRLTEAQHVFAHTGGLHAAGFFDTSGRLECMREDVGRHNALDKLIGARWQDPAGFRQGFVMLSGRSSFELIQKAARAGVPVVAAVGAPSSLAVELADEMGITLLGFVRDQSFNCYTHEKRILFK